MSAQAANGVRYLGYDSATGDGHFAAPSEWLDKAPPYRKRDLMAAAPALLEALEAVLEDYIRLSAGGAWPEGNPAIVWPARAAIKLARGEQDA